MPVLHLSNTVFEKYDFSWVVHDVLVFLFLVLPQSNYEWHAGFVFVKKIVVWILLWPWKEKGLLKVREMSLNCVSQNPCKHRIVSRSEDVMTLWLFTSVFWLFCLQFSVLWCWCFVSLLDWSPVIILCCIGLISACLCVWRPVLSVVYLKSAKLFTEYKKGQR